MLEITISCNINVSMVVLIGVLFLLIWRKLLILIDGLLIIGCLWNSSSFSWLVHGVSPQKGFIWLLNLFGYLINLCCYFVLLNQNEVILLWRRILNITGSASCREFWRCQTWRIAAFFVAVGRRKLIDNCSCIRIDLLNCPHVLDFQFSLLHSPHLHHRRELSACELLVVSDRLKFDCLYFVLLF